MRLSQCGPHPLPIFQGSIRSGFFGGQAGVDLPRPPILPASFRSAESPEVLSCTPATHQSEQPSTRFRDYPRCDSACTKYCVTGMKSSPVLNIIHPGDANCHASMYVIFAASPVTAEQPEKKKCNHCKPVPDATPLYGPQSPASCLSIIVVGRSSRCPCYYRQPPALSGRSGPIRLAYCRDTHPCVPAPSSPVSSASKYGQP